METLAQAFASRLRTLRVLRGMSQEELADRAGLSKNAIGLYERAERFPRVKSLEALRTALHTDSDTLIGNVLAVRDHTLAEVEPAPSGASALRELTLLLKDAPEHTVQAVLDIANVLIARDRDAGHEGVGQSKP